MHHLIHHSYDVHPLDLRAAIVRSGLEWSRDARGDYDLPHDRKLFYDSNRQLLLVNRFGFVEVIKCMADVAEIIDTIKAELTWLGLAA